MPRKHKEYLLMGTVIIIGLVVMIMSIAALNQKLQGSVGPFGAFGSLSVKEIYKSLMPGSPSIVIKTAGMAYIGSIITLTISVATLFYGAALIIYVISTKKRYFKCSNFNYFRGTIINYNCIRFSFYNNCREHHRQHLMNWPYTQN